MPGQGMQRASPRQRNTAIRMGIDCGIAQNGPGQGHKPDRLHGIGPDHESRRPPSYPAAACQSVTLQNRVQAVSTAPSNR